MATIGIDLRALQTGHKYRGIGEVTKQTANRIVNSGNKDGHSFIFYEYENEDDPKKLLDMPKNLKYKVIKVGVNPEKGADPNKIKRTFNELYGNPILGSGESDVFIQYDYAFGVPKNTKTILIKHDLIPLLFWDKYFESVTTHLKNKALRTSLRTLFTNYRYKKLLRRAMKDSELIINVSESTKQDLIKYLKADKNKLKVVHLGVDVKPSKTDANSKNIIMPTKPYLLFVGAADARRRVDELIMAYNTLKAEDNDIQLVLVGENFVIPEHIPNSTTRNAILKSSYKNDILTLGYVDDIAKQKLFKNALAFIYPTKYEGFGIPVLEAMLMNCSVITYKNSSIPEVAKNHAFYAKDWEDIVKQTEILIEEPSEKKAKRLKIAKKYAESFTWDRTSEMIYNEVTSLIKK
jgi:glycosyltransferase involved in cell wall biosynthesis